MTKLNQNKNMGTLNSLIAIQRTKDSHLMARRHVSVFLARSYFMLHCSALCQFRPSYMPAPLAALSARCVSLAFRHDRFEPLFICVNGHGNPCA